MYDMAKKLIYIVEDEKHIQELLRFNLEENGYEVECFEDGETMFEVVERKKPDLFVLDIMLPGVDGFEICKKIKENYDLKKIPIIMLTAKNDELDRVLGLELGADDYISKPFSVREFVARVKVAFRRQADSFENSPKRVNVGRITIDFERREVYKDNQIIEMTFKEFELLKLLIMNRGKVLSRDMLLQKIWGFDFFGETRTVDVHIRYLRQKIEDDDNNPVYIETVRGIGYRFSDKEVRE
ncbi:two-component system alkaline phosphatase synthesis response regulator PhoP [Acetivibrio thermocellus AD2]|uniref:Stage 0 sporulation protein A homolog n=2 Tax=Acetivibrio thermocellus TaxID=1515 RepID=A0AB36TDY6_ACETH|nr:two component transcriptional regulator, winged helix family [Acetivibrio thermocellus DSM 1313]ALX07861.1 two component transcriptional regulator, winged helix family [Acetivibrio thermocellus AD2]ANV75607.1 two component transcriptional regulator, winged helix family [Acetivibrio thermocellus DSM 2360]EIC03228.1 response regulator receiver [Acetivibrio thermocellus YS]THJ79043.1 response regulator transcription factor [Acetivibrio thermocellus]CDG36069.1 Transcriptional regulatory protein